MLLKFYILSLQISMNVLKELIDAKIIATTPMEATPVDALDLAIGYSSMVLLVKVCGLI